MSHTGIYRQPSHKPSRYAKPSKREIELQREVRNLTRQLLKVRKALQKAGNAYLSDFDEEAEPEAQPAPQEAHKCPECDTSLQLCDLGYKQYRVCPECKYRKTA